MIVDVGVHPIIGDPELRSRIGQPWANGLLPHPLGSRHLPVFDELVTSLEDAGDPAAYVDRMLTADGVDAAVLTPLGRGLLSNPQEAAAVTAAVNEWVAERWLPPAGGAGRLYGAIRVTVNDLDAAMADLERWADDPRFVAIVVPLRTVVPYGDERYFPLWRAAAELGLPVYVLDDGATVVEHPETPVGPVRYFAEKHVLQPMSVMVHLTTLITGGVFERLPELRFVFGDGGLDLARSMLWRVDKDWKSARIEVPWVQRLPSAYADDHVRFAWQPEDGTRDGIHLDDEVLDVTRGARLLLYASHFPYWRHRDPSTALSAWPDEARERVLGANAIEVFPRLGAAVTGDALASSSQEK